MRDFDLLVIVSLLFALAMTVLVAEEATKVSIPPCVHEDEANCYWLAHERGNKIGTSFININGVKYWMERAE